MPFISILPLTFHNRLLIWSHWPVCLCRDAQGHWNCCKLRDDMQTSKSPVRPQTILLSLVRKICNLFSWKVRLETDQGGSQHLRNKSWPRWTRSQHFYQSHQSYDLDRKWDNGESQNGTPLNYFDGWHGPHQLLPRPEGAAWSRKPNNQAVTTRLYRQSAYQVPSW